MMIKEVITVILLVVGCFFFLAGTLGVLRFPDLFTRLHALTKADNLGLGFIAAGMAVYIASPWAALKIFLSGFSHYWPVPLPVISSPVSSLMVCYG